MRKGISIYHAPVLIDLVKIMLKLKVGDKVKVTAGKDKGREGEIERIVTSPFVGAVIPGLNVYKRHVKSMPERKGGVYDIPRPISLAKIAPICPSCKKVTRFGFKFIADEKVRICKKCGREIKATKAEK